MAKKPAKRTGATRKPGAKASVKRAVPAKSSAAAKVEQAKPISEKATEMAPAPAPEIAVEIAAPESVSPVEAVETPVEATDMKGPEAMEEAMTKVKAEAETLIAKAKEYATDFGTKAKDAATELGSFAKGNFEAVVESGKIASEGTTSIAKDNLAFTKKSVEDFATTSKELAAVKSPGEFVKMQGDFIRKSFDENVAQITKSTEAFMKLIGDAYQPISNRVSIASEKIRTVA